MMNGLPRPIEDDEDVKARSWTRWAHEYGSRGLYLYLLAHNLHSRGLYLQVLRTWALMDRADT